MKKNLSKSTQFILTFSLFCVLCVAPALAQEVNIPSRGQDYVSDFAGLLKPDDKMTVTKFASELEKKTTAQLAVVTIKSTQPETIQGFSIRLFDQWKIGQKGKDNGALILIAVNDRKAWITTGYGLEGAIPDVIANKVVQERMIPYFKTGQFSQGIREGSIYVISLIAKEYDVQITGQEAQVYETVHRKSSPLQMLFTILMFIVILGSRSGLLGYFLMGSMIGGRRRGGYWHGAGFSGSGGGFSGGFGGFGGGMSGGGGGGGGW